MKGISYLVSDEGKKTHVVLDLELWKGWEYFLTSSQPAHSQARQPGGLNPLLKAMGYSDADLETMNRHATTEALLPLTDEELGLDKVV
jgi:hypothetical protein